MKLKYFLILIASVLTMAAGTDNQSAQKLEQIEKEYWQHQLQESPYLQLKFGIAVQKLPDLSFAKAKSESDFAQSIRNRVSQLDGTGLNHDQELSSSILEWESSQNIDGLQFFWVSNPATPYASPVPVVHRIFKEHQFENKNDLAHYLQLLKQYPHFVHQIQDHVREQFQQNIILPKDELALTLQFFHSFEKPASESVFFVSNDRLKSLAAGDAKHFQEEVSNVITSQIDLALRQLTEFLAGDYAAKARETVGLSQYPKGKDYYRYLVKYHTTMNVEPEAVHQKGVEEIARINEEMAKIRKEIGFKGSKAEFHQFLKTDARFFPKSSDEVGQKLMEYVRRIEPKIDSYFLRKPRAQYGVKRLDPALEGSMTFGYYQDPTKTEHSGFYYYNGSNLKARSLLWAGALIYHELIPGHHFQICLQSENNVLPEFRREEFPTAFVEGWAEYASALAGEMGMYQGPYDRYGRLAMEIFLANRLVVDTGMNYLGWSRQKAIDYMKENLLISDAEINTETLRYCCDIPGQALAYKMGSNKIFELRDKAKAAQQQAFDIRNFHDAVLGNGAMPMAVLEKHIDWFAATKK